MSFFQLNSTIKHCTHPQHSLTVYDSDTKYLCDRCKIPGIGKRYHCHGCAFDLHEFCGTCPMSLSSFMHPNHSLKLDVTEKQANRQHNRICDVCCDSVEGMFYGCKHCEFDVHPLCTQLPEALRHVLHQAHPLRLLGSFKPGICAVCRGACKASSWRYTCAQCGFDIHLSCILVQCEKKTTHRGIPAYAPPSVFPPSQNFGGYPYGIPYWNPYPSPFFPSPSHMHHHHMPQPHYNSHGQQPQAQNSGGIGQVMFGPSHMHHHHMPQPHYNSHGQQPQAQNSGGIGQVMFGLVKTLGIGVISNMIFGMDVSSLFAA